MATRRGICTNAGRCKLAGAGTEQEVDFEDQFACHECGSPLAELSAEEAERSSRFPLGVVMGAAAFTAIAGFSFWVVREGEASPSRPLEVAAAPAPPSPPLQASAPKAGAPPQAGAARQVLLRLAGSSTIGARLAPALAEAYLASLGATGIQTSPAGKGEVAVQGTREGVAQVILVAGRDSTAAFEALQDGSAEIGMSSRRVRPDEVQKLAALGVMTSPANEHVLALDGIAVIVSKANPIGQLKRGQLSAIFSGSVADWSGIRGRTGPVHVYAQTERSGTMSVFQALVLGTARLSAEAKRLEDSQAVSEAVVGDPGGIGIVALPYIRGAKALPVADEDGMPMIPNALTLVTEDYLLSRRLYLYTPQASKNPHVSQFVEFALGLEGQAAVKKSGFVELTVRAEPRSPPAGSPPHYVRLTAGAKRLSTSFRFAVGSSDLDNRALSDLERVVDFLRDNDLNGASVKLLGFSDNAGAAAANVSVSRTRARRVALSLAQRGITGVTMAGFGSALPVASNAGEEGRVRNRRVEIWVSK